jgi:hypothetical protein
MQNQKIIKYFYFDNNEEYSFIIFALSEIGLETSTLLKYIINFTSWYSLQLRRLSLSFNGLSLE